MYRSLPSRHQEYREIANKNEIVKTADRETWNCEGKEPVVREASGQPDECNGSGKDDPSKDAIARNESIPLEKFPNERTNAKRTEKQEEPASSDPAKPKKNDRSLPGNGNKTRIEEQEEGSQEQSTPRISLIKPPRILSKLISPEIKSSPVKHGERKSSIPIFKRSSKEFEDIRSPQESSKRSLIPQRYFSKR